jgi:hypothetical protein
MGTLVLEEKTDDLKLNENKIGNNANKANVKKPINDLMPNFTYINNKGEKIKFSKKE